MKDDIFHKLLLERPHTLVKIAIVEQQAAKTFQIHQKREEEPMEVDSIASDMQDMSCKIEHLMIAQLEQQKQQFQNNSHPPQNQWQQNHQPNWPQCPVPSLQRQFSQNRGGSNIGSNHRIHGGKVMCQNVSTVKGWAI